ncbi:hypothetical protein FPZ43_15735 [Mucilaginibacter pallidiroseus]|uniref:Uncharacterized protein n=1 Tax=Mucilaginibacter pallidiroseus TaxID=2599295 RepID=A0A563U308_9SPHI|nr:hypothetical protein [Mucilaginibacter pallidiroseus]TWR25736.1 hypothetical protein FPZ43_15735 [Mucilaginibacter pallidiroseus]
MAVLALIDMSSTYVVGTQVNGRVYIKIINPATGQLTNGNNIAISYQVNNNGILKNYTINIAGQSQAIYTGKISDSDPLNPYYTSFLITGQGETLEYEDTPYGCDLSITSVEVRQSESAPGAADAVIVVQASSSYLPILYSLDGNTYQNSAVFTGLSGGARTVYVKDANNCTGIKDVSIPVLNNLLVSDPSVTLPGGNISRWSAAFNPIVFTYQRKDFSVNSVQQDTATGNAIVTISENISAVQKDDYIYLKAGVYNGVYKVTGSNGYNGLIIDIPYSGNATGFININRLRPYYRIITKITYTDKLTGQLSVIKATNRPNAQGTTRADISNFLQSVLRPVDESNYALANYRDDNLSASYTVSYAEAWDEGTTEKTSAYVQMPQPYYVVYAAKQLGDHYSGNLASYVPFASVPQGSTKAKWITDFNEPAYSNGYPFDISFIYSEHLMGKDIFCEMVLLDINRKPLPGGPQTTYLLNEDGSWLLNNDGSRLVIARQGVANIPVPAQLGLNRLLISQNFNDDVYYLNLTLKYIDGGTSEAVTQTQTVRIDDAVDDQSVYLRWIGLSGSWNYYRFVFNQEVSLDVQNAVIIKNYVSDWQNQQGIDEVISKSAGNKVKVMAEDLSVDDIKGLQSIKYSPKVQMLVNKNPVKWQTVVINTATYAEYETRNGRAPFSITFNLPAINVQAQ